MIKHYKTDSGKKSKDVIFGYNTVAMSIGSYRDHRDKMQGVAVTLREIPPGRDNKTPISQEELDQLEDNGEVRLSFHSVESIDSVIKFLEETRAFYQERVKKEKSLSSVLKDSVKEAYESISGMVLPGGAIGAAVVYKEGNK